MKVKVINNNLNDLQDKVFRPIGSVFECNEERADYLLKNNAIIIVDTKEENENIKPLNEEKLEEVKKQIEEHIQVPKNKKKKSSKK